MIPASGPDVATAILFGSFFLFLATGMPIVFAMSLASLVLLVTVGGDLPLTLVPHQMVAGTDSFLLLAIPMFFLAGEFDERGWHHLSARALFRLSHWPCARRARLRDHRREHDHVGLLRLGGRRRIGHWQRADPSMKRQGYHPAFGAAVVAAAATAGPIIPPSIPMIIYAAVAEVSVGALFMAGMLPGLVLGAYLMFAVFWISRRRGYPIQARASWAEFGRATLDASWALLAPVVVLGAILIGVVTPTEAAALAVLYSLVVGLFVYRELKWRDLPRILRQSAVATGVVMIIVGASGIMGWEIANLRVGEQVLEGLLSISREPWVILLFVNALFLILGACSPLAVIIVFVPVFLPLVKAVGIDLVHFGLVVVLNVTIGLLTPPVGYAALHLGRAGRRADRSRRSRGHTVLGGAAARAGHLHLLAGDGPLGAADALRSPDTGRGPGQKETRTWTGSGGRSTGCEC